MRNSQGKGILEKVAYLVLAATAFLLPVFFVPSQAFSFQAGKGLLLTIGVVISLALYILFQIKNSTVSFPKNLLFLSVLLLPVTFVVSTLANGGGYPSFLGFSFELGTVAFILLVSVFVFLVSELFQSKERIFYSYLAFFASFGLVTLYQGLRFIFGADLLSFGIFANKAANLIGNWNELSIFFGVSAILSLVTLEMLELKKLFKVLLYVVFVLSIVFLAIVNFSEVWVALGIFSLIFFVYIVSFDKFAPSTEFAKDNTLDGNEPPGRAYERKISYNSLALLIVSLIFVISGNTLGPKISNAINVTSLEVRPSWTSTYIVLKATLKSNPLVGAGANTFNNVWLMHKPEGINGSIFWNTDFAYGIGLIPTFFVTTGVLGILVWLLFLSVFVWSGIRAIFQSISDLFSRYLITSSFLVALFLWIMNVVYVPTVTIFSLSFFFSGLFIASLYREGLLKRKDISLSHHPKLSFVSVIVLVVLLLGNVALGYSIVQRSASLVYFQKSILGYQKDQNLDNAEATIRQAIKFGGNDIYYRGLSEINLIRVNSILSRPGATPESVRTEFQQVLANSIENAKKSTEINKKDYQNWVSLARVYAALVPPPFSIPGAYENAKRSYEEALNVNPHSPNIILQLARLEISHNDLKKAREYVNKAIVEKQNFAEAHFLLAQIEVTEGNVYKAVPSLETTVLLTPNNPGLFFQLGILKYSTQDFNGAIGALVEAIKLVPDYANAKYFLGLSLNKAGDTKNAIAVFEDLEKTNPDNDEVKVILTNLRAGKDPFANTKPPITSRPEKRDKLPLEQTN